MCIRDRYEIVLTENGELSEIKDVPPDDAVTIVPVYVAFRTSDCCPNALCDNVKYIASTSKYHHAYMEKLKLWHDSDSVSYTHLRAHETGRNLVCRLLLEKKKTQKTKNKKNKKKTRQQINTHKAT